MNKELDFHNQRAAEKLTAAFKSIWNNQDLKIIAFNYLSLETANSLNRNKVYKLECKEPWQKIIWCYCSLNSKGSAKSSKSKWISDFRKFSSLINPEFLFREFDGNEEKIFCAVNLILRHFAGGRFLTVSNKKYYSAEYDAFEKLANPTKSELSQIINNSKRKEIKFCSNKNSFKTESFRLFKIYKESEFKIKRINHAFSQLDLVNSTVEELKSYFTSIGISDKFARNIKMDLLADNILGYYAIDSRISNVLEMINYKKDYIMKEYKNVEVFFNTIINDENYLAKLEINYKGRHFNKSSMTSWEFDRLLFKFSDSENNLLSLFLK